RPRPTLFPYTTLFRSERAVVNRSGCGNHHLWCKIVGAQEVPEVLGGQPGDAFARADDRPADGLPGVSRILNEIVGDLVGAVLNRSEEHTSELQSRENL